MTDINAVSGIGFLLDLTLKISLFLALAFAVAWMARGASAAVRQLTWKLAISGLIMLPLLSSILPHWRSPLLPSVFLSRLGQGTHGGPVGACAALAQISLDGILGLLTHTITLPLGSFSLAQLGLVLWASVTFGMMCRILLENLALAAIFHRGEPLAEPTLLRLLDECAQTVGLKLRPELVLSETFTVPATFGFFRPKILMPSKAAAWDTDRWRVVLLHEMAHIQRKDFPFNLMSQLACALQWHNPLVWMAAARLRQERESAADDLVLASGMTNIAYAEHLFDIAKTTRHAGFVGASAVAMAHDCSLKQRVAQILDPKASRARVSKAWFLAAAFSSMAILMPLAAMAPGDWCTNGGTYQRAIVPAKKPCSEKSAVSASTTKKCDKSARKTKCNKKPVKKCDKPKQ